MSTDGLHPLDGLIGSIHKEDSINVPSSLENDGMGSSSSSSSSSSIPTPSIGDARGGLHSVLIGDNQNHMEYSHYQVASVVPTPMYSVPKVYYGRLALSPSARQQIASQVQQDGAWQDGAKQVSSSTPIQHFFNGTLAGDQPFVPVIEPSSAPASSSSSRSLHASQRGIHFSLHPNASPFLVASQNALASRQTSVAAASVGKERRKQNPKQKQYHQSNKKTSCSKAHSSASKFAETAEENAKLSGSKAFLSGKKRGVGKGPEKDRTGHSKRVRKTKQDPSVVLGPWGRNEDLIVLGEVVKYGTDNIKWNKVAAKIPGRLGRQVRARWYNHLDPSLVWTEFTWAEDLQLIELHGQFNGSWKKISDLMPGRSENQVKNRFNSPLFRILHNIAQEAPQARSQSSSGSSGSNSSGVGVRGGEGPAGVSSEYNQSDQPNSTWRAVNSVI